VWQGVPCAGLCCLLVAFVLGAVVSLPRPADGGVTVFVDALGTATEFASSAFAPTQVGRQCWLAHTLPRGDSIVPARVRAQDVAPPFPLKPVFTV